MGNQPLNILESEYTVYGIDSDIVRQLRDNLSVPALFLLVGHDGDLQYFNQDNGEWEHLSDYLGTSAPELSVVAPLTARNKK